VKLIVLQALFAVACTSAVPVALADEPSFKLTTGLLMLKAAEDPSARAWDVNLRHTSGYGNVWVGWFRQADPDPVIDTTQIRVGWDNTYPVGAWRVTPSVQAAWGGFWGGSLNIERGETWYAGAGIGRTNLSPYVNLNYDPNDALMASGGYRWNAHESLGVQWVHDNRENPDQRHWHLIYRTGLAEHQRLTLDLLSKSGNVTFNSGTTERINKLGLSVTYDWHQHFVRLAYDPNVNFSTQDMLRVSVGTRF
jgi:hypothetical protein